MFIGAYFMRMDMSHGGMAAGNMQGWVQIDEPRILWANTIALVLASILGIAKKDMPRNRKQARARGAGRARPTKYKRSRKAARKKPLRKKPVRRKRAAAKKAGRKKRAVRRRR